ncbi:MAG: ABC transporter substrate-binding protein [Rhizobiaceae bacterium]|nr:ABC transporter substrate-binding protein [Rhizobiaceae bacterium]
MRFIAAAALVLGLSCPPVQANEVDTLGNASRIVAIGGSITEIVYALGEEHRLAGRDSTSLYPDAALALPDVGYMRQLSPEGVLSVDPDGMLALEGSGPPEALDVLKKASVPLVMVPETFDRDGILAKIRAVGKALDVEAEADGLARSVGAELDAATALTAGIDDRRRVLFVLSLQGGKVLASGTGTAADGMISLAGGVNAVSGFSGYKQLTDEAIIEARPEIIMMMARGGDLDIAEAELFAVPALAATPAARNGKLVKMNGLYLLGFGPRTASAVRDLARSLYGDDMAD